MTEHRTPRLGRPPSEQPIGVGTNARESPGAALIGRENCGLGPERSPGGVPDYPTSSGGITRRVRLITMAWGQRYIEELVSLTLPAILAPANLPALAAHFVCELII